MKRSPHFAPTSFASASRPHPSSPKTPPGPSSPKPTPPPRPSPSTINTNTLTLHTTALTAELSRADLTLTIHDGTGRTLLDDTHPVCFTGHAFRLSETMPPDEHYFALGDKTGPLDHRGQAFDLWNTDAYRFQESTDPLYKSIPFFLAFRAGSAFGLFLDNTFRSSFDFGKLSPDAYTFGAADGPLDYYIFAGPTPRDVVEQYTWLTGRPPLPPLWMLGYQQSRYTYAPEQRLMDIATRLRAEHIPADVLYLDIGFQEKNRPFTVDPVAFPDFPAMVARLRAMNFKLVVITDLHIANLPNHNYAPYDTGIAGNEFVHNPDGSVYTGIVWPGPAVFPDFTRSATRDWWGTLYTPFVHDGVSGFWNDMNEPSVFNTPTKTMPLDVVHRIASDNFTPRSATHAEIHNVYGMENSRATYDGLRKLSPDERPFVLTRATYAGGQRYATTWTGDDSSTWNHLRMTAPMLKNLGLSGFSFAGADVGGFAGSPPPDLLTRWLEVAAFHPIDRDHTEAGTSDQEPWADLGSSTEDQLAIRRHYIEARYRLLPYLYTLADETSQTGIPMMRPVFLDYPHAATDGRPIDIDPSTAGEFLLGHDLLIAPSPYPEEPDAYTVELPTSNWYDFWTGKQLPPSTHGHPIVCRRPTLRRRPRPPHHHHSPRPRHPPRLRARRRHPPHRAPHAKHRRNPTRPTHSAHLRRPRLPRLTLSGRRPHLRLHPRRLPPHELHLRSHPRHPHSQHHPARHLQTLVPPDPPRNLRLDPPHQLHPSHLPHSHPQPHPHPPLTPDLAQSGCPIFASVAS